MNLSQFMVDTKTVNQIITEYGRMLECDLVASVGATNGIGGIVPGQCYAYDDFGNPQYVADDEYGQLDLGRWVYPDSIVHGDPPMVPGGSEPNMEIIVAERSLGLMALDTAAEVLTGAMASIRTAAASSLRAKAAEIIGRRVPGGYRFQALSFRASHRGTHYAEFFLRKLCDSVRKKKKRRTGIQMISTRRAKPIGWGTFSWRHCYRRYQGRPSIPAHVWLAQYRARLAKRRKTNRKGHKTGVHVPPTKYPRPRVVWKPHGGGTVGTWGDDYDASGAYEQLKELIGDSDS